MALRLRRPERADLDVLVDWMGDPEFRLFLFGDSEPRAQHMGQQMLGVMSHAVTSPLSTPNTLLIEHGDDGAVGIAMLQDVSWRNRSCFVAVYLAERYRTTEVIDAAVRRVFQHCFDELNLHRAGMRTVAGQDPYARACERAGGKREFVFPGHAMRDGRPVDMIGYGVLRSEFEAARGAAVGA